MAILKQFQPIKYSYIWRGQHSEIQILLRYSLILKWIQLSFSVITITHNDITITHNDITITHNDKEKTRFLESGNITFTVYKYSEPLLISCSGNCLGGSNLQRETEEQDHSCRCRNTYLIMYYPEAVYYGCLAFFYDCLLVETSS